jgi:hypothetical protein
MLINHLATAERRGSSPHRPAGIKFASLMKGHEGAPGNFELALLEISPDYHAPRHRHNFDQVRVMLEGDFEWDPGQPQREGSVGYFCEGLPYTQRSVGHNKTLLLQCGGPSGDGYMSAAQLAQGIAALKAKGGRFEEGLYSGTDEDGRAVRKDSYQAAWEEIFGRRLIYPKPRYDHPVIVRPANIPYRPVAGQAGLHLRDVGEFNDCGLRVRQVKMEIGTRFTLAGDRQPVVGTVLSGGGNAAGAAWTGFSTFFVERGESVELVAEEPSELILFCLPVFAAQGASAGSSERAA